MEEPKIIYESPDFLAIAKPAGMTVHPAKVHKRQDRGETYLTDWLISKYPEIASVGDDPEERPGIVHRLDKDTSGVIIVARNQPYFEYLKSLFQGKIIHKKYVALVYGDVKEDQGTIDKPIGIKPGTIKRTVHGGKMPKEAITDYKVLKRFDEYTFIEVTPRTGRTHQIRVHLASIGNPIVGDLVYGGKRQKKSKFKLDRQFLHARSISFETSPGHAVEFEAPLPEDLTKALKSM